MSNVKQQSLLAKDAARTLNRLDTAAKNAALAAIANAVEVHTQEILAANSADIARASAAGMRPALLDRLQLDPQRIRAMAQGVRAVIALEDPVGQIRADMTRPNGMRIRQVSVPLGVVGIIYEARPNVTLDACALCLKTGNSVGLRGGTAALDTNRALVRVVRSALASTAVSPESVQLIDDTGRTAADEMMRLRGIIDCLIPRGGAALIKRVVEHASVPVIETGSGVCHTYIDERADATKAILIADNAKMSRPSVCNSMETLLLHEDFESSLYLLSFLLDQGVTLHVCPRTLALLGYTNEKVISVTEADYATEYNDYILNVRMVSSLDEALGHIARYSTRHSECIVTEDAVAAARFLLEVDAAAVYHNASTRFTDGFEFGFGAEIGISTQKLHARGPMGLPALTTTKYIVTGDGQIRT
jgi:glutamate-5-semialdehyde dehydrogenase